MTEILQIKEYLQNKNHENSDQQVVVLMVLKDNDLMQEQIQLVAQKQGMRMDFFVVVDTVEAYTKAINDFRQAGLSQEDSYKYVLLDADFEYIKGMGYNKNQLLFGIYQLQEEISIKILTSKSGLEIGTPWVDLADIFYDNYSQKEPENGLYKWGQRAPQTADYICVDCGYIEEFPEGAVFTVCEACLSGEFGGPSGPKIGYWEMV
jgi:hypothetical protein